MNNISHIEKRNQRLGIIISVLIHIILILIFLLATVWQAPNPPNPEYGIEINFGTGDFGSGEEPVRSESEAEEEVVEEQQEVEESEEVTETESAPKEVQEVAEQNDNVETQNVDDSAPQLPEEKTAQTQSEPEKEVEESKPQPKANPKALFPGDNKSQGDTSENSGDQGKEDGKVDADALMGPQGGGGGSSLDMAGWIWDNKPNPRDNSEQNGKIVFEIKVDGNGEVISVRTLKTTVSPEVQRIYQDEVKKLSFRRIGGAGQISGVSTGKITFIIRSR